MFRLRLFFYFNVDPDLMTLSLNVAVEKILQFLSIIV